MSEASSPEVDLEALLRDLRASDCMIIFASDSYVGSIRDPSDPQHIAIHAQVQVATEGKHPIYLIWVGPWDSANLDVLLETIRGANLKCILFAREGNKEDLDHLSLLLRVLMPEGNYTTHKSDDYLKEAPVK